MVVTFGTAFVEAHFVPVLVVSLGLPRVAVVMCIVGLDSFMTVLVYSHGRLCVGIAINFRILVSII